MTTEEFEDIVAECRLRTGSDTQSVLENALRDYHKKVTTAAQVIEENDIDDEYGIGSVGLHNAADVRAIATSTMWLCLVAVVVGVIHICIELFIK